MVGSFRAINGLLWFGSLALAAQSSVAVDLTPYFNHKAFGTYANETIFDTAYKRSFPPLNDLATDGIYTSKSTGIQYDFPSYTGPSNPDNLICENQTIAIPSNGTTGKPFSLNMLVANDLRDAIVSYNLTYIYTDGTTALAELRALSFFNWLTITHGEIISPFTWTPEGKDWNTSQIFEFTGSLDPTKTLAAVQLPQANNATVGRIHIFSMSVWESDTTTSVQVQSVRPTQKWTEQGSQVVEVTVNNIGSECVSGSGLAVTLQGAQVSTVEMGSLKRLCPGDQKRVDVGVTGDVNSTTVAITLSGVGVNQTATFSGLSFGFESYTTDLTSIGKHESPQWFDDAKFGIMIHCTSPMCSFFKSTPPSNKDLLILSTRGSLCRNSLRRRSAQRDLRRMVLVVFQQPRGRQRQKRLPGLPPRHLRRRVELRRQFRGLHRVRVRPQGVGRPVRRRGRKVLCADDQAPRRPCAVRHGRHHQPLGAALRARARHCAGVV